MPTIPLHVSPVERPANVTPNLYPSLLHTPSGLAILEIQGTINVPAASTNAPTSVGHIEFPLYSPSAPADDTAWMKRVYLYVGKHQRLTGEVKKLAKPYAVIRRREKREGDPEPDPKINPTGEELEIVEIVRYKLLFAHRPEPVGTPDEG